MSMLNETAEITAVGPERIRLGTSRRASCSGCSLKGGCGQYLLARDAVAGPGSRTQQGCAGSGSSEGSEGFELARQALPGAAPRVGDQVRLSLRPAQLLQLTALFYLLPLFSLMAMTLTALWLGLGEGSTIVLALAGLLAGLLAARALLGNPAFSRRLQPGLQLIDPAGQDDPMAAATPVGHVAG